MRVVLSGGKPERRVCRQAEDLLDKTFFHAIIGRREPSVQIGGCGSRNSQGLVRSRLMERAPRRLLAIRTAELILAASIAASRVPGGSAAIGAQSPPGVRSAAVGSQPAGPTFSRDIAPILFSACVPCHRPEGAAPFSLIAYEDVKRRGSEIVRATTERIMPPWKPEPGFGQFADERRLTDSQIAALREWVDRGMAAGDPAALPPLPRWSGEWALGKPDLVLETPSYTLRASGDDVYRNFVVPIPEGKTRYVRAWQFLPGNPRVVHHATMQFDPTGTSRRLDAQDPEPGYEGLIPHSVGSPDGFFLGWLPGHTPYIAPDGMAWPLSSPLDLVMMLHLRPSGREERVEAKLGLYFSDRPPRLHPVVIRLTKQHIDIPAGERNYQVTDSFLLSGDVDAYTVQPHAHHLAREMKAFATLPDGTRKWLIYIRRWEFEWQGVFRYRRPEFLPAGTVISMEYTYDNSAENPHNPSRPPRRVTFGERTDDEMAELWLQVVPRSPADSAALSGRVHDKVVREDIIGLEKRLETDPSNAALHDDVALLYAEVGRIDRTAAHFAETVRLRPQSASAHYNLGHALFQLGRADEAIAQLREALSQNDAYALAHDALGVALHTAGKLPEAVDEYHRAVALEPADPDMRLHLAIALRTLGRLDEAAAEYRRVLQLDPGRKDAASAMADLDRQLAGRGRPRR
jgi:tetratricopeptide (TPR) repeat protein